jgi:AcrR family transcriptional regulator
MSSTSPYRPDPLSEILLCPTTGRAVLAPERLRAPRPGGGTGGPGGTDDVDSVGRTVTRAGNPMARSRAAIVDGARRAVSVNGTAITMTQVAAAAGVAKGTLYNHFRTREDVLAALLLDEIDRLIGSIAHLELGEALRRAATALSEHPLLESLGGADTSTLAVLARVDVRSQGWARVAEAAESLLNRAGRRGTPTVLRWLSSFVVAAADDRDIVDDVAVLIAGLPPRLVEPHPDIARTTLLA